MCFISFQIQNEIKYNKLTSFKRNLTVLYDLLTHKIKVTFGSKKVLRKEKKIYEK